MRNSLIHGTALLSILVLLAAPAAALEIGDQAPTFSARSLDGAGNLSISSFRGKIVYLDFWASWCGPCLQALPRLEELRKEFAGQGVQFLAVNLDRDLDEARKFLREHPVGYPSATDPEGQLPQTYEVRKMPTSFLIDRDGVVRYIHPGFRPSDIDEIRAQIRRLLGGTR